jgi:hypothetical protein
MPWRPAVVASAAIVTALMAPAQAWALAGGATGSDSGSSGSSGSSGGFSGSSDSGFSGGSGGGGGTVGEGSWWGLIIFAAVWLLIFLAGSRAVRRVAGRIVDQGGARAVARRAASAEAAALVADSGDGYWHPHALRSRVAEAFFPIQLSWAERDIAGSRPYVSDALYERHRLQLEGLESQGRVNRIEDLRLTGIEIVRVHNVTDDAEDRFVARIECSARDWMEDAGTGRVVNGNPRTPTLFEQYWSFSRHPRHGWVLDEIQQGSEGRYHLGAPVVNADEGPVAQPA